MDGPDPDRTEAGFRSRTRTAEARSILREAVAAGSTPDAETIPVAEADGRTLAGSIDAARDVPHYDRAAMDGYAVRATDTAGADGRSPNVLRLREEGPIGSDEAVRVHTGSELPTGADAVVRIERADRLEAAGELAVRTVVVEGADVGSAGEDVASGQRLYEAGRRLRPSDLGLLRSAGRERVPVAKRPTVAVAPTGEELVRGAPEPGEVVETNGLTVSRLVERWGARATYRNVVTDDREALRVAIQRDLTKDVVVTTGGSSVGERDLLPEVIDDLGEVLVHGVAMAPGHPVALGVVEGTPVLALPGYPVACIVAAVQFLRPLLAWLEGRTPAQHPTRRARLDRKIRSDVGTRTFARVRLAEREGAVGSHGEGDADGRADAAIPTRTGGAGVLSSVALADGWVVVPESREGIPAGEPVAVEDWEPTG